MSTDENRPISRPPVLNMIQQLNELKIRLEFAKTLVPEYYGGSKSLFYFIRNTEKILANFTFNDPVVTFPIPKFSNSMPLNFNPGFIV